MDKSITYILMCTAASEIRELWTPAIGDVYYSLLKNQVQVVDKLPFLKAKYVWLPRADQLCTIIEPHYDVPLRAPYVLNKLHQYIMAYTPKNTGSLEQMLIQFIMLELHNMEYIPRAWRKRRAVNPQL